MSLWIIGNPEHRRVQLFQNALQQAGLPAAQVLSYQDLLSGRYELQDLISPKSCLRIESPGENFRVEQLLLAWGAAAAEAENAPFISRAAALSLSPDRGRILYPRQWYLGFCALLQQLHAQGSALDLRWMSTPPSIAELFDKPAAQAKIAAQGVAVPESLGLVRNFAELEQRMREHNCQRVFVKLAHGSSASGVVALHRGSQHFSATTSVELARSAGQTRLYNSLKIRCYQDLAEIKTLIDALCAEGVQVERWLPKARTTAGEFDLRVLVVAGKARLQVMRQGRSPMTNLHLGNQRGDLHALQQRMGAERWQILLNSAETAARAFPQAWHLGLDILLKPGLRQPYLLEANAFGDFLLDSERRRCLSYQFEIKDFFTKNFLKK